MIARTISGLLLAFGLTWYSCENTIEDEPLPPASFPPFTFNVQLPDYSDLNTKGWVPLNDLGVRGVIVYRKSPTNYLVFERNCSFNPYSAGATVQVASNNLDMFDPTCGSRFSFNDGMVTSGPAVSPLRIYVSSLSGDLLTITDESANGR